MGWLRLNGPALVGFAHRLLPTCCHRIQHRLERRQLDAVTDSANRHPRSIPRSKIAVDLSAHESVRNPELASFASKRELNV